MPIGRPTELTASIADIICDLLRRGNYREVAARAAGTNSISCKQWMRRGIDEPGGIYGAFRKAVLRAEQEAEVEMVDIVRLCGPRTIRNTPNGGWSESAKHDGHGTLVGFTNSNRPWTI